MSVLALILRQKLLEASRRREELGLVALTLM
jgi:hypothetical protein